MSGVTRSDRIRNEYIRGTLKVTEASKKVQEGRLRWYGHLKRRTERYMAREVMEMEIPGNRRRGRPRTKWKDKIAEDMREKQLRDGDYNDRNKWRRLIRNSDPELGKTEEEEEG